MKRFKVYEQHDTMQCGITCLKMVCGYYGKDYSLNFLSKYCFATTEGVSLLGMVDAATKLGLQAVCNRLTLEQLQERNLPCILHWSQNHFVVLYKIRNRKKFYIADPGKGKVTYTIDEFKTHWISTSVNNQEKGIAMFLEPTQQFGETEETENKEERTFKFIFGYLNLYRKYFLQLFLGLLLGCVFQLIMPFLTQSIVDIGIKNKDIAFVWIILAGEFTIVLGHTITDFIRRWLLLHISMRINISLISDFFIKLLKLPMAFFDTKLTGDILQRMHDHTRIQSFLTTQTLNITFTLLSLIVFGTVLFIYDNLIFATFTAGSITYGFWIATFLKKRKMIDYEIFEQQSKNQSKTYQLVTSMQEIKLQNCECRRRWEWEDIQADLFTIQMKSLKLQQSQEAGGIFINELKNIIITVIAATAVINGQMTLGMMLAVQYIIGQLNSPIEQIMNFIYSLQDVKISLERINEIHAMKNEDIPQYNNITEFREKKEIDIDCIEFKYDPHNIENIIDNLSFKIPQGKVTAIVGASGSGKTTLIKLMLGYYPVASGSIKIANNNIKRYNLKWWRKQCGVVMQDGVIFSESIARNIAADDRDINVERLEQSAKIANIHTYITSLPLKYNTLIGQDGIGLSQGQKQRILIARAVYKNPSFIFLDEATNALDAENERTIVRNLDEFYKGRTVVVVAHRLSTVKNADQIIVLDRGKVVEKGNHTTLIKKQGTYYNLVKNQLELGY